MAIDSPSSPMTGPRWRSILKLPWLAHGHISPLLKLTKNLLSSSSSCQNPFLIFYSTPVNLASLRTLLPPHLSPSIRLIEVRLPLLPPRWPPYLPASTLPATFLPTSCPSLI
ncbi:hypothetical protein EUGRSUZ_J00443 [Eucalyptus grandis]|uniref:Uncharacterized protein n=2 Tax=Eucalyptus grandis TaxID=71139 RepID=A0ACC3J207_EUCGR|nr:hypothetical protein EUGRSUZ_J00443 [Eucalyptus grandis]